MNPTVEEVQDESETEKETKANINNGNDVPEQWLVVSKPNQTKSNQEKKKAREEKK